jgi:tetratricopeptide (TPR) repeat protein
VEVLKGVAYMLAFSTALRIARRREGAVFLGSAVVVTGLVLAIAALLHPAFGARKLYGIWEPANPYLRLAPVLNPNNLAQYLNLAICLALSACLARKAPVPRPLSGVAVLFLCATQAWIASRGGVATMLLGVALVLGILLTRLAKSHGPRTLASSSLLLGAAAFASILMFVLGGSERASSELLDTDLSKLSVFGDALKMARAYFVFGAGRGSFESAFPAFRDIPGHVTFTHPENLLLQWLTEWGAPVTVAGLCAIGYALRPTTVFARSSSAAGAWAGIIAVAAQNLVDLGSEIPGVALAAVVCGAIVVAGATGRRFPSRHETPRSTRRLVPAACLMSALCAIVTASLGIGEEVSQDKRALYTLMTEHAGARKVRALARAAMLRHAGEPYFPFLAAEQTFQARDESAMPWIEATLERARVYGPAHLLLARFVAPRSPSQARFEYRLAMVQSPELFFLVMTEAPRLVGGYGDASELIPEGRAGMAAVNSLESVIAPRLPATCVRLDAEFSSLDVKDPGPALRAARSAVEDTEDATRAPWCEGRNLETCVAQALHLTELAERKDPNRCEPYVLHARARAGTGDSSGALEELSHAADHVKDRVQCLQSLATVAKNKHDRVRAEKAIEGVAHAGCAETECSQNLKWAGSVEEALGDPAQAHALYRRALGYAPDDEALLESIARTAAEIGLHAEAVETYERLKRMHPGDERWQRGAAEEKRAAATERARLGL